MTYRQRDRMAALRRRRTHLRERMETYRVQGNPSYTAAELEALGWAIDILMRAAREGMLGKWEQ